MTPSTNKKVNEVLATTYATWDKDSERLNVPKDPRLWSKEHVGHWLSWAIREFSLVGPHTSQFVKQFQTLTGKEVCGLSKESFLARAPPFTGDILWAHLEILQKDNSPNGGGSSSDRSSTGSAVSNLENIPNNFVPVSAAAMAPVPTSEFDPTSAARTYTELDSSQTSYTATSYPTNQLANQHLRYSVDYNADAGSTVDTSSEYSYQNNDNLPRSTYNNRVPPYGYPVQDPSLQGYPDWSMYPHPAAAPHHPPAEPWHQPPDFHSGLITSGSLGMHHHPAFLQVISHSYKFLIRKGSIPKNDVDSVGNASNRN